MSDDPGKDEYDEAFSKTLGFPKLDLEAMSKEELLPLLRSFARDVIEMGCCSYAEQDFEDDDGNPLTAAETNCKNAGEEAKYACLYCQAHRIWA